jgi:hypothetical protein
LADCSTSWVWRVVSAGTSKTPPELVGAIFELGKLLLHVAEHFEISPRADLSGAFDHSATNRIAD